MDQTKFSRGATRCRGLLCRIVSDFDRAEYLLNVQNGTINLKDFFVPRPLPDDRITKMAAVTYDPQAKSEIWESFLFADF